tara:strand:+ start:148 stop:510 length:363 start_codon:yes stop_codon:yes gene_type:complete
MNQFESKDLDLIRDLISNRIEGLEENYYTTISGQKTLPKQQVIIQAQINQCKRIIDVLDAQAGNPTSGKILGDASDPTWKFDNSSPIIHLDEDGNEHKDSPLENHLNTMAHIITNLSKNK